MDTKILTGHADNTEVDGPGEALLVLKHLELCGVGLDGIVLELCKMLSIRGAGTDPAIWDVLKNP